MMLARRPTSWWPMAASGGLALPLALLWWKAPIPAVTDAEASSVGRDAGILAAGVFLVGFVIWQLRTKPPALGPGVVTEPTSIAAMRENARWFIGIRWLATLASELAVFVVFRPPAFLPPESASVLQTCVLVMAGSNIAYGVMLARVRDLEAFLAFQACADLFLLTAMLHFSGGIENPLYPIYVFHVVIGAALLPPKHAYGLTALASLLLLALGLGEGFGVIERYPISLGYHRAPARVGTATMAPIGMLARIGSTLLLFWVTAHFAVALRARAREHEKRLLQATAAQRDLNRQLGLVVDSIGAALLLWTSPNTVSWSNHIALADHQCDRPAHDGCGPSCLAGGLVPLVFATGVEREEERIVHHRDGKSLRVHARAVPLRGDGEQVEMVLLIVRDVTATRAMEAEVLHATRMAALGRVAAGMAHEIGNPLAAMNVRLALLRQNLSPTSVAESVDLLQQHVARIHRLVHSVRRFGRPPVVERRLCSVTEVANDILRMLRLDPRARNVDVVTDFAPSVAPVEAVRDHLVQVLMNLCINGMEAMPAGGRLSIGIDDDGDQVRIVVADSGTGIPESARAEIFRPFFTTKDDGSGLGLFLSQRFVCEMGGTIEVEETEGGGATFVVRLPRAAEQALSTPAATLGVA